MDDRGELGAIARGGDVMPGFRVSHGRVLGPCRSRIGGGPYVSAFDNNGELGAIARGGDATPVFRVSHGRVLGPCYSIISGGPDVSAADSRGELGAIARGGEATIPFFGGPDVSVPLSRGELGAIARGGDGTPVCSRCPGDPVCSRIGGGPDVSAPDNRGELGAIARGGPRRSRISGGPDVSAVDSRGELGAIARGGDAIPSFRNSHTGRLALGPGCSRIIGSPDVSDVFNRGEFGAIARGGDPMPILSRSKRHSWARSQSTSETRSKTNGIFLTRCVGRRGQTHTRGCCLETPVSLHTARPGRPRCLFLHKSPASRAVGLMRRIARRLICLASASPARKRVSLGPNRGVRTDVRPAIDSALVATITSGARRDGGESEDLFALVR
eukprot:30584-Pelagococcus_subviridis.AAC.3